MLEVEFVVRTFIYISMMNELFLESLIQCKTLSVSIEANTRA